MSEPVNPRNSSKLIHFSGTVWFVLCACYIFVFALRQTDGSWWVKASVSGYFGLAVFLLVSLYSFAIFRGVARSQKTKVEHPLTMSSCYCFFYDTSPFLGVFAGVLAGVGIRGLSHYLLLTAGGTLCATFVVWVVVDPVAGLLEMLLPSSREHRRRRLSYAKAMRERHRLAQAKLFAEISAKEGSERGRWSILLPPYAEELADLMISSEVEGRGGGRRETEVVDIGVIAWQMGGVECMRRLHSMAMEICRDKCRGRRIIDYVSIWWDGIGSWQSCRLDGESEPSLEENGVVCG